MHCSKIISQTLKFDPNLILNFMMIIEACRLSWLHSCEHFKLAFLAFLFLSSFFRLPFSFPFSTFSIFHDEAESTTLDHWTLYRYNLQQLIEKSIQFLYKSQIQMDNNNDIFFIRHAQSQLNIASHNFRMQHNLPYIWKILCQNKQFLSGVRYNPQFIDCSITEQGQHQCIKARQTIVNNLTPDVILVSPLQRTLETCSLVFQNRNIPVIVQPLLAQALRTSCDISKQLQGKIKRFPNYNFDNVLKQGNLWFLKNQSEENQQKYYEALKNEVGAETHDEKCKTILKVMCPTFVYEKPESVRSRVWRIKQLLKNYKEKYNKIAVVAHYNIINFIIAKEFDENNEPKNSAETKNCEVQPTTLQQLLKVQ